MVSLHKLNEVIQTVRARLVVSTSAATLLCFQLQFQDGTRPKQITWGCKRGLEVCCGTDCCPAPANNVNANVNANGNNAGSGAGGGGASQNMAGVAIG